MNLIAQTAGIAYMRETFLRGRRRTCARVVVDKCMRIYSSIGVFLRMHARRFYESARLHLKERYYGPHEIKIYVANPTVHVATGLSIS